MLLAVSGSSVSPVAFSVETYGRLGNADVYVLGKWADAAAGAGVFARDV
jgi:hypothetical protein